MPKKGELKASASKRSKQQRKYNSSPKQKKNRALRNAARRRAEKNGRVSKGDGKDVDHKRKLKDGGSNKKSNTRILSKSKNRADNGKTGGRKKKRK